MLEKKLQSQLENLEAVRISIETIQQRLTKDSLCPRIPARSSALTVDHRRARLIFAIEHRNLVEADKESFWTSKSTFLPVHK